LAGLETQLVETDATIARFCAELGIATPFASTLQQEKS
jgi:hypothetical protein